MAASFLFYDVETSGFSPRSERIMQFAGQRTDLSLQPVGEPFNYHLKLSSDVLPDPEAILVTGITPQKTLEEGLTEVEFLKIFDQEIATPEAIFVGFNNIRFDDEFMRFLHYRNFYDPYEWQYKNGRSRWDLLDLSRIMRALRPEGIIWPFNEQHQATNRLELLATVNELDHSDAHDALSDVKATLGLAQLIREKQPKLFEYFLGMRNKLAVAKLVNTGRPFVYASGKYPSDFQKTTVVSVIAANPERSGVLVYDLRHDPAEFANLSASELADAWQRPKPDGTGQHQSDDGEPLLPIKTLQFNRCPTIAPLGVLDEDSLKRLQLNLGDIEKHHAQLGLLKDWTERVLEALKLLNQRRQAAFLLNEHSVDEQLYDGFFDSSDKTQMAKIRHSSPDELSSLGEGLRDERLKNLLPLYKARNYPNSLNDEERAAWEQWRTNRLMSGGDQSRLSRYFTRISQLLADPNLSKHHKYLLEELNLYGQSLLPVDYA